MRTFAKIMLALCPLFVLVLSGARPVSAQGTPDGSPPSAETVCDGQTGAAYGLCTAYCEAMDCDSVTPQATKTACDKVGGNFQRIAGQRPPCDVTCPCVTDYPGFLDGLNAPVLDCQEQTSPDFSFVALIVTEPNVFPFAGSVPGLSFCGDALHDPQVHPITEPQAQACIDLIKQKAAAAGVTCHGPGR